MKFLNKKTTTVLLTGFAALAMSGCGSDGVPSTTGIIPGVEVPPGELGQMSEQQAKDAMALNAFIYPIVAPVTNIADCLISTRNLLQCIKDAIPNTQQPSNFNPTAAPGTVGGPLISGTQYKCTPGDPAKGTFTYTKTGDTMAYSFSADCADTGNQYNLHDLVVQSCFLGIEPVLPDASDVMTTYEVQYSGSVSCTPTTKTGNMYHYRTIGNNLNQTKSDWTFNGTLALGSNPITVAGNIRSIAKYGEPNQAWDDLFLGSDEEWVFESVALTLGSSLVANGKGSYIKHPNDHNNGDGEFYIDFAALTYAMIHSGTDITANVSGTVSSSCQPMPVTYATTEAMQDVNDIRDANGYRMPSSGAMTMSIPNYLPAPAVFSAGTSAQVAITASEGTTTYTSWREIVAASSCSGMQDWMDNIIQPKPPVVDPTAGDIYPGQVLYDDDSAFVLAADKKSATGKTAGRAVNYYLSAGQGYVEGQTVGETTFQFSVPTTPATAFVNVYLRDENGTRQKEIIYSNADWNQLQIDHPTWTIRTDYIESDFPTGTIFQGNFILRIGDSTYTGIGEDFSIGEYLVEVTAP